MWASKPGNVDKGKIVLDVQHQEKSALSVTKLLDLFHDYEHIDLIGEA
jgi:ABC-type uncharacterized transport system ATPase component